MCNKMTFASRGDAKAFSRGKGQRHRAAHDTYPYVCGRCGGWHLTSLSPQEQRRKFGRAA